MFCAPTLIVEPSTAPATRSSAVNGGQMTTSTSDCLPMDMTSSPASATPSALVLFIFQLPAMSFLREVIGEGLIQKPFSQEVKGTDPGSLASESHGLLVFEISDSGVNF